MKTFKYRLYPTKQQIEKLEWTLARCCELYNAALQERKEAWNACKKHPRFFDAEWRKEHAKDYRVNYYDQANQLPELKRELRTEYQEIGAHVLQNVLKRVEKAFDAFFRRVKAGQTPGYPRYQGKDRYDSFCFPSISGWKLVENRLTLSNIGSIKVKMHREVEGKIKTCTINKQSRQLVNTYETIVFEDIKPANMSRAPKPKVDEETGKYLPNGAAAKAGLNKSILDAGWSMFIMMCESKAASAGTVHVLRVDPKNTSQICSACLKKGPHKDLSERTHTCVHCGVVLDRDHNAALNILRLGRSHQGKL